MRTSTAYEKVEAMDSGFKFLTLKSGRRVMFHQAKWEVDKALTPLFRWTSRMFKLISDNPEFSESEWEQLDWKLFEIESWIKAVRSHYEEVHGVAKEERSKKARIAALRQIAGRTPEEAEMFLKKADELESS